MDHASSQPLMSVVMPTYNRAHLIGKSIESILNQGYRHFELIIVDDASTDETETIVRSYQRNDARVKYVRNEANAKIVKTLNRGLAIAEGAYIARADDDDVWADNEKLGAQVLFLETHPEYDLVGTGAVVVDENNKELFRYLQPETDSEIRSRILFINPFVHPTVVFRRSVLDAAGFYDENLRDAEDWDMWLRIGIRGKFYNLPTYSVLRLYGLSGASIQNRKNLCKTTLGLLKKYRKHYPYFFAAYLFNFIQRLYIALPHSKKLHAVLFRIRRKSFDSK